MIQAIKNAGQATGDAGMVWAGLLFLGVVLVIATLAAIAPQDEKNNQ